MDNFTANSNNSTLSLEEQARSYLTYQVGLAINLYVSPIVCTIGICGNTLSFIVMTLKHNRTLPICIYLAGLAISDTLTLVSIFHLWVTTAVLRGPRSDVECKIKSYIFHSVAAASTFTIVAVTVDRFLATYMPVKFMGLQTRRKVAIVEGCIFLGSFIVGLPFGLNARFLSETVCSGLNGYDSIGMKVYAISMIMLCSLIPFALILAMNIAIAQRVAKLQNRWKGTRQGKLRSVVGRNTSYRVNNSEGGVEDSPKDATPAQTVFSIGHRQASMTIEPAQSYNLEPIEAYNTETMEVYIGVKGRPSHQNLLTDMTQVSDTESKRFQTPNNSVETQLHPCSCPNTSLIKHPLCQLHSKHPDRTLRVDNKTKSHLQQDIDNQETRNNRNWNDLQVLTSCLGTDSGIKMSIGKPVCSRDMACAQVQNGHIQCEDGALIMKQICDCDIPNVTLDKPCTLVGDGQIHDGVLLSAVSQSDITMKIVKNISFSNDVGSGNRDSGKEGRGSSMRSGDGDSNDRSRGRSMRSGDRGSREVSGEDGRGSLGGPEGIATGDTSSGVAGGAANKGKDVVRRRRSSSRNPDNMGKGHRRVSIIASTTKDAQQQRGSSLLTAIQRLRTRSNSDRRRLDKQLTRVLLLVSLTFLCLTLPQFLRYAIYTFVDIHASPATFASYFLFYHISQKLYAANSAINFVLYCFGATRFRQDSKKLLCQCFGRK